MELELWLIILIGAVGGFLLILCTIIICVCCRRRKRKRRALEEIKTGQNGNVWQAHENVVEANDDEELPRLDGLCKDTISGSTFPRYKKEQNTDHHKEDGLCEETKLRSLQRRGKLEGAFLKPEVMPRSASESGLSTVLPLGTLATTMDSNEKIDDANQHESIEVVQIEHGFRKELLPNGTVPNDSENAKRKDSSNSSDESDEIKNNTGGPDSTCHLKAPVYRKRSKSFELEAVPEYTKPVKRAVSNPSINARESIIKKGKRFESLDGWKYSMPIPDYPSASSVPEASGMSSITRTPSFLARELRTNTDDYGQTVSYTTETRSYTDGDVTIVTEYDKNETSNIPAPPPLPKGAFEIKDKESNLSTPGPSYAEQRLEFNTVPAPPALPQGASTAMVQENINNWKTSGPSYTAQTSESVHNPAPPPLPQGAFTTLVQEEENRKASFEKVDSSYQPTTKAVTEKKQTISSWKTHDLPAIDFRNVKLNPTSTRNKYDQEQTDTSQDQIPHANDASRVMPSTLINERNEYKPNPIVIGHGQPMTSTSHNTTVDINARISRNSATNDLSYSSTQTEYTKETHELSGNGIPLSNTSVTTKTQSAAYKTTERYQPAADSHSQDDFRGFKLRSTPDSIKQQIGFRQDLNPDQQVKTPEVTTVNELQSNGDARIPASDLSSQKMFGLNSYQRNSQIPQNKYGSESQTKQSQQLQKTYGFQQTTSRDTGLKVFSVPGQSGNVTTSESTSKQTVSMNGTVKKHSDTTNPGLVIERLNNDGQVPGKAVPAANESVVMRPKKTENSPIDTRGETAEERKKNWKREQMEQRLSTALFMTEKQPIMQASGLALKSVLPELFTKIKQIGNQNEEDTNVTVAT